MCRTLPLMTDDGNDGDGDGGGGSGVADDERKTVHTNRMNQC